MTEKERNHTFFIPAGAVEIDAHAVLLATGYGVTPRADDDFDLSATAEASENPPFWFARTRLVFP